MGAVIFVLVLFIIFVGGGWVLGKGLGKALFPNNKETYVDKSVHHHYHTTNNNTIIKNETISVIDDETKESVLVYKKSIKSTKKR